MRGASWGTPAADVPHAWGGELAGKRFMSHPGAVPTAKRPRSSPRGGSQAAQALAPAQARPATQPEKEEQELLKTTVRRKLMILTQAGCSTAIMNVSDYTFLLALGLLVAYGQAYSAKSANDAEQPLQ